MSQQFASALPLDVVRPPALAVLVNFGLVAGRKPSRRELEELGHALRDVVPVVSIFDEQRYEVGEQIEVLLEEVRIEVGEAALAVAGGNPSELQARIVEIAQAWVAHCAGDPGAHTTLADRLARQTVVEQGDDASST